MRLKLLKDNVGDPDLTPLDWYTQSPCCWPVTDWLVLKDHPIPFEHGGDKLSSLDELTGYMDIMYSRASLLTRAINLVKKHVESDDVLRTTPYVVFSYELGSEDYTGGEIEGFVFKFDNNGNTFKVIAEDDR